MEVIYRNIIETSRFSVITAELYSYKYQKHIYETFILNKLDHPVTSKVSLTIDEAYLCHIQMYEEWQKDETYYSK